MKKSASTRVRRGFTLLEVLLVAVIIIILAGLIFIAVGPAVKGARAAAEGQMLANLSSAVKQFKESNGYFPPLVAEGSNAGNGPIDTVAKRVHIKGQDFSAPDMDPTLVGRFLRYEATPDSNAGVTRSSVHSLPIYILGVLKGVYDGADGPGFMKPEFDGRFAHSGAVTKPLFDMATATERVRRNPVVGGEDDDSARSVLLDRWQNPIRYYRWQAVKHVSGVAPPCVFIGAPANDPTRAGQVRSYNVPKAVGDPNKNAALRVAEYAIISAGPDGRIDDTDADAEVNKDNIVEVGP